MAERFRYIDSNGDSQVIASTGGHGGQPLDRVKEIRRNKDTHIIVAWSNRSLFGEFPTDRTQFQSDEPEIFFEQLRNGTWELQNRVYAKDSGTTTTGGNYKIKLYGFQKYGEEQQVNITNTTTHTVDVAEKLAAELDSNYVIDAPTEANVPGGYPQVENYSLDGRAGKVVREITRDFKSDGNDWTINWTGQTDANGNYIIRYEPQGFGGAVDTLDDSIAGLQIQNWKKERTDRIINKTRVVGTLEDGTQVTGTAENTSMINRYGTKFETYQVGYLGSQSEADRIAENKLVPGIDSNGNDITETPESGKLKVPTLNYREGVENDSYNVLLPEIDVDDTYTCVTQKLYYPAGNTELVFEFEKEGLEEQAEGRNALNEERAKVYPEDQTDVGNQDSGSINTEDVNDEYDQHEDAQGEHDVAGQSYTETIDDTESNEGRATASVPSGSTLSFEINTDFVTGETDKTWLFFQGTVSKNSTSANGWDLTIVNNDTGTTYFSEADFISGGAVPVAGGVTASTLVIADENLEGDQIDFEFQNNTTSEESVQVNAAVAQLSDMTINQPNDPSAAQAESDGSTNTTNPDDSNAGDTTSLDTEGSTAPKNVDIATEDKTDR